MLHPQTTLNCAGRLLDLGRPITMGILNITPDSFYDGGRYADLKDALARVEQMIEEGASIIDIGGMSSRPGAKLISVEEELKRVLPVIESIRQEFPDAIMSLDTVNGQVAQEGIDRGIGMINDISAGTIDPGLIEVVASSKVPYVLMHMKGVPENMHKNIHFEDVVSEVLDFLIEKTGYLRKLGVGDIILDVGFGFGKTIGQNYQLLKQLNAFLIPGLPILVGLSRKSMVYKPLQIKSSDSLSASSALHLFALQKGASILRVHDVKEANQCIRLWEQIKEC